MKNSIYQNLFVFLVIIASFKTGITQTEQSINVILESCLELTGSGSGIILSSPNGLRWKLQIDNQGAIIANKLSSEIISVELGGTHPLQKIHTQDGSINARSSKMKIMVHQISFG